MGLNQMPSCQLPCRAATNWLERRKAFLRSKRMARHIDFSPAFLLILLCTANSHLKVIDITSLENGHNVI